MNLNELLEKRLVFVSGKGGVGKTSVSALLGLLAAKQKKRTLIIEVNSLGRIAPLFNEDPTPHEEIAIAPYLSAINLDPKKCFEEYVLKQIRFKKIYNAFFNNKYVTNFLNATPGLNELLMLGKIYELEKAYQNKLTGKLKYDLIIVDSPATGHGLSFLEVPSIVLSVVKVGPMKSNAESILSLLNNQKKTAISLVTLAEEMPVSETKEFIKSLSEKTKMAIGPLFVNGITPKIDPVSKTNLNKLKGDHEIYVNYYELVEQRRELNEFYIKKLKKDLAKFDQIELKFQFRGLDHQKDFSDFINLCEEKYS